MFSLPGDARFQKLFKFKLHKGQRDVVRVFNGGTREIVVCAGRRWGKSALAGYLVAKVFSTKIKEIQEEKTKSVKIWIVAPTYKLAEKVMSYTIQFLTEADKKIERFITGGGTRPIEIKIAHNIWIQCVSADNPSSLTGEELDLLIVDETADIPKNVFFDRLLPSTSSKSRRGQTVFIGTPRGKNHFYVFFQNAKENGAAFHFPSLAGSEVDQAEWERAKKLFPEDYFRQNYEASFLEQAATVFRRVKDIIDPNCLSDPKPDRRYVIGLDLAQIHDFTVAIVIDKSNHHVVAYDRFSRISYPLQIKRIFNLAKKYNRATIVVELNATGLAVADELRAMGAFIQGFKTVGTISADLSKKGSKQKAIEKLAVDIENRNITIPDWEVLIDELGVFGQELTAFGNIRYRAPEGYHDDAVMALALANWVLKGKTKLERIERLRAIPMRRKKFQYF